MRRIRRRLVIGWRSRLVYAFHENQDNDLANQGDAVDAMPAPTTQPKSDNDQGQKARSYQDTPAQTLSIELGKRGKPSTQTRTKVESRQLVAAQKRCIASSDAAP